MMKLRKKFLALFLVFTMVLSLMACGGKEDTEDVGKDLPSTGQEDEKDQEDKEPEVTEAPTPTEEPVDVYPAFDLNQRTIKVGIWWDYYYTSAHNDIYDNPQVGNTETAQMQLDNVRRIEKKYNCRIEFVNLGWNGIIESINTSITAGTPECDIYLTDLQFGIPAVMNGLALDLDTFVPDYCDLVNDQKIVKPLIAKGAEEVLGGNFFFTEQALPVNGIYLGYNVNMIEDLGLEDPQELYRKGEWTWEKFAEYAKAGTRDLDNDGNTDIFGFGGIFTDLVNGLVLNNGGSIAGGATEGLSSQQTVKAFEFIDQLYNKDLSARPWNGDDWDDNLLAWSDGKVMFWTAQAWSLKQEMDAAIQEGAELPFEFKVVPYPLGPDSDGTYYSPVAGNWYIIPVGVEEPDKVFQVFEEFLNWHQGDEEYRDDPTWFESCFMTLDDVELAMDCGRNLKMDIWGSFGDYFRFGDMIWWPIVVNKDTTVAQAIESAKPVLQDALDYFRSKRQ